MLNSLFLCGYQNNEFSHILVEIHISINEKRILFSTLNEYLVGLAPSSPVGTWTRAYLMMIVRQIRLGGSVFVSFVFYRLHE